MKFNSRSILLKEYQRDQRIQYMQQFCAHGVTNVYEHSNNVASISCWIGRKMKTVNQKDLVLGALLHDFYLYDWHNGITHKEHHQHGILAAQNASEIFDIDDKTKNIIEAHMWPINFKIKPHSKEAVIVNFSDKLCAIIETTEGWCKKIAHPKKYKKNKRIRNRKK